jgi:hypothetical protein
MPSRTQDVQERQYGVKRTTKILQISCALMLLLGVIMLVLHEYWGVFPLVTGVFGLLGLTFDWHRGLVAFTVAAWANLVLCTVQIIMLVAHPVNPIGWVTWIICSCLALPAAVLSSTLHLLKVWQKPIVSEHTAPLVDPASEESAQPRHAPTQAAPPPQRSVWPPPPPSQSPNPYSGDNLSATARVAEAAHSGDTSRLRPGDVAGAAQVGAAAAPHIAAASSAWPPPQ